MEFFSFVYKKYFDFFYTRLLFNEGCMAERLKTKIIEKEKQVDLICGPDSYKDLPRMLAVTQSGQTAGR